jgi:energy-coupling factor transport system ATP-binding protein
MPQPIVKVENVFWKYARAEKPALCDFNIEINEGEAIAVMGADGSGKSTFCRLLNGLIPHSVFGSLSGSVTVAGMLTSSFPVAQLSRKVGMAFDDPGMQFLTASVFEEVAFALENMLLPPQEITEKTNTALEAVGLSHCAQRSPMTLSGGQKQRLAIAAAIAMADRVLVLDEPCASLDPAGSSEVLSFLQKLKTQSSLAIVMATSSPEDASRFADKICLLKNGSILAFDTPGNIFSTPGLAAAAGIETPELADFYFCMKERQMPLPFFSLDVEKTAAAVMEIIPVKDCVPAKPGIPVSGFKPPVPTIPAPIIIEEKCETRDTGVSIPLKIENLTYSYAAGSDKPALSGIDICIGKNEFVAVIGQNGSGKTTLLKNICGLLRPLPQNGKISIYGRDSAAMGIGEISENIACVMQDSDNQLFSGTVYEEVAFSLSLKKIDSPEIKRRTQAALETLGLQDKAGEFPQALCRADRVKTVFAAVLAMGAGVLLLDEPLAGQDAEGSRLIMQTLTGLHEKGCTIILVTHNIRIAAHYARRLIVMAGGRIIIDGNVEEVFARTQELETAGIILPPVSRLSAELHKNIRLEKTVASAAGLAAMLSST